LNNIPTNNNPNIINCKGLVEEFDKNRLKSDLIINPINLFKDEWIIVYEAKSCFSKADAFYKSLLTA
jgi:hypothetical protein